MRTVRYVDGSELMRQRKEALIEYSYKRKVRCLRMPGNLWLKERFCSDADLEEIQNAYRLLTRRRQPFFPSSWSSLFHALARRPRPAPWSIRAHLPNRVYGAWEECRDLGVQKGLSEYDLISAYGWAGISGPLPVVRSAVHVRRWEGPMGLYLAVVASGGVPLPPILRTDRPVWVTGEEVETLALKVKRIVRGLSFARTWSASDRVWSIIRHCRNWKSILRAYWGNWASTGGLVASASRTGKTWTMINPYFDPASASFIVSRVRSKVAHAARQAVHVFVDAVLTPEHLATGTQIGDWKKKAEYATLRLSGTGRWTGETAAGERVVRHSGIAMKGAV